MNRKFATYIPKTLLDKAFAEAQLKKLDKELSLMNWHTRGLSFCGEQIYLDITVDERQQPYPFNIGTQFRSELQAMIAADKELVEFLSKCSDVAISQDLSLQLDCEMVDFKEYISGKVKPAANDCLSGPEFHLLITDHEDEQAARLLLALYGYEIMSRSAGLDAIGFHNGNLYLTVAEGHEKFDSIEYALNFFHSREDEFYFSDMWVVVSRHPITDHNPANFSFNRFFTK